ncbi:ubiquitin carboxyl-terminal hydrolase 8-like [Euwallacea similis]|uniref:ubiquitin carboxyl-terminal hydrolase 8-like n=1 Tax=Euwallacea similis TaxID=1736056 RepID=UPI00344B1B91
MEGVADLHIATNMEDLKHLAQPKCLGKNTKAIEKVFRNLYNEILKENIDQEKCYIYCYRFLFSFQTMCQFGDRKFYNTMYLSEVTKVNEKLQELEQALKKRYAIEAFRENKKRAIKDKSMEIVKPDILNKEERLFDAEFISVKQLFNTIQDDANILIIDIRPEEEYSESKVKFEKAINIPENLLVPGLSANVLGHKLMGDTQKIWEKRDSFDALVFVDWNSSPDNFTSSKLMYLKESIVEWDCLKQYKQHPVIINGGFKEFLDSYPGSVTNVHVNFIRNNEDIDELLELDSISYPEPDQNISIMPLKQFTIEELEESTKIEESAAEEYQDNCDVQVEDTPAVTTSEIETKPVSPKGGGASLDKQIDTFKEETIEDIKNTIEKERMRLLLEARNLKNKRIRSDTKENVFEDNNKGDRPREEIKRIPPPIRRDIKPKKDEFTFGGWCGLVNIKNTCYMNTILQCLKCIPIVSSLMHSNYNKFITRHPPQIINEFGTAIQALCDGTESNRKVFRPSAFYDTVCKLDQIYKKGNHEDCMEFFLFLFNRLNDDCSYDIKTKRVMIEREKAWYSQLQGRTSLWVDLFYHQFRCTKICQSCHLKADSYETDNTLMLPVPYRPGLTMVHLRDLINEYQEDNQILDYKCSKCQNLGVVNTKEVVVAPEILVIVLKRYYQDEYQESRKNNVCVDFDFNFTFGNNSYTLYSVAEHRGTMEHGHYFAHGILNDSIWVELNDERTSRYNGDWDNIRGSVCAFFYCKNKG